MKQNKPKEVTLKTAKEVLVFMKANKRLGYEKLTEIALKYTGGILTILAIGIHNPDGTTTPPPNDVEAFIKWWGKNLDLIESSRPGVYLNATRPPYMRGKNIE